MKLKSDLTFVSQVGVLHSEWLLQTPRYRGSRGRCRVVRTLHRRAGSLPFLRNACRSRSESTFILIFFTNFLFAFHQTAPEV